MLESRVSSDIQTPQSWLKISAIALFFKSLLGVWISDETLLLVYDILHLNVASSRTRDSSAEHKIFDWSFVAA